MGVLSRANAPGRLWGLVVAVALLGACGSSTPIPPLDEDERAELRLLRQELAGRSVTVSGNDTWPSDRSLEKIRHALHALGMDHAEDGEFRVRVWEYDDSGWSNSTHDGRFHWTVFTLALVPVYYEDPLSWDIEVETTRDGRLVTAGTHARWVRHDLRGWVTLPLALLPGWSHYSVFGGAWHDRDEKTDQLNRAVLGIARAIARTASAMKATRSSETDPGAGTRGSCARRYGASRTSDESVDASHADRPLPPQRP